MKGHRKISAIASLLLCLITQFANAQGSLSSAMTREGQLATQYTAQGRYAEAVPLLRAASRKHRADSRAWLGLARCESKLNHYAKAVDAYRQALKLAKSLPDADYFAFAEMLLSEGHFDEAIDQYKKYLEATPGNEWVQQKIWRITNRQYLMEDSTHYALRRIKGSSDRSEISPRPIGDGLIYVANRERTQIVERTDGATNLPFYKLYYSSLSVDSVSAQIVYTKARPMNSGVRTKLHEGPVSVYGDGEKMVVTSNEDGHTLGLFFVAKNDEAWTIVSPFPHNSAAYSITDPSINGSGNVLYFSSNMKKGYGGFDLYVSRLVNGKWTEPENLGPRINTPYDEKSPFMHARDVLYFASNGLPGLGGFDLFRSALSGNVFEEPQNIGYPINSNRDDFGIYVNSDQNFGYLSSNRKNGGFDDDIYEFDMDLQTYPFTISGVIKYKESAMANVTELPVLANGKVYLVDNLKNTVVQETSTDENGNFSLTIPYFSQYLIRVMSADGDEHRASLEIQKYHRDTGKYEIVVVKDAF